MKYNMEYWDSLDDYGKSILTKTGASELYVVVRSDDRSCDPDTSLSDFEIKTFCESTRKLSYRHIRRTDGSRKIIEKCAYSEDRLHIRCAVLLHEGQKQGLNCWRIYSVLQTVEHVSMKEGDLINIAQRKVGARNIKDYVFIPKSNEKNHLEIGALIILATKLMMNKVQLMMNKVQYWNNLDDYGKSILTKTGKSALYVMGLSNNASFTLDTSLSDFEIKTFVKSVNILSDTSTITRNTREKIIEKCAYSEDSLHIRCAVLLREGQDKGLNYWNIYSVIQREWTQNINEDDLIRAARVCVGEHNVKDHVFIPKSNEKNHLDDWGFDYSCN